MSKSQLPLDSRSVRCGQLHNGARVLWIDTMSAMVYANVTVRVGSDFERQHQHELELFHLIEHMGGRYTSSRYRDHEQVTKILSQLGIEYNATTGPLTCNYFMYGHERVAPVMLDLLLSSHIDFVLDRRIFKQEVRAVEQELRADAFDNPWYDMDWRMDSLLYPGHRRSIRIERLLDNMTFYAALPEQQAVKQLLAFRCRFYVPANTTVLIAGPAQTLRNLHDPVMSRLAAWHVPQQPSPQSPIRLTHNNSDGNGSTNTADQKKQTESKASAHWPVIHLVQVGPSVHQDRIRIAFQLPLTRFDDRRYGLVAAAAVLADGGFASRLMRRLRTELGAVYGVSYDIDLHPYDARFSTLEIATSLQAVPSSTPSESKEVADKKSRQPTGLGWRGVLKAMVEEIEKLQENGITEQEYAKYRVDTLVAYEAATNNQSPTRYAGDYGSHFIWLNTVLSNADERKRQEAVDRAEINQAARSFLDLSCAYVVVGTPGKELS